MLTVHAAWAAQADAAAVPVLSWFWEAAGNGLSNGFLKRAVKVYTLPASRALRHLATGTITELSVGTNAGTTTMNHQEIGVRRVSADAAASCVEGLAEVLLDCVAGGASVSFMWPLARATALDFWHGVVQGVARGERALLVAEDHAGRIVGTVQLILAQPENQPHRADVAKMLVHRDARRRGVAQRLMAAVDEIARAAGKTVLVLDTVTGGDAERLYQRAGWQRVGEVPKYALMPDGEFCSTTFYYRHL
jgi:GNAT superfamily N-acetyltransferase